MNVPKLNEPSSKTCFVIAPIGDVGTDIRIRSDKVLKHIVAPAVTECGYEPLRADQISKPGIITAQVIQHILKDPLVIADLTGPNANVSYELAIRHAVRMPVVQIIDAAESIPFDVAASRTISFDYRDLDIAQLAREEIVRQIKAVEKNPREVDNPLTMSEELQGLRQSDNPLEKSAADIMAMLGDVKGMLTEIHRNTRRETTSIFTIDPSYGKGKSGWATTNVVAPIEFEDIKQYMERLEPTAPKPEKPETDK